MKLTPNAWISNAATANVSSMMAKILWRLDVQQIHWFCLEFPTLVTTKETTLTLALTCKVDSFRVLYWSSKGILSRKERVQTSPTSHTSNLKQVLTESAKLTSKLKRKTELNEWIVVFLHENRPPIMPKSYATSLAHWQELHAGMPDVYFQLSSFSLVLFSAENKTLWFPHFVNIASLELLTPISQQYSVLGIGIQCNFFK